MNLLLSLLLPIALGQGAYPKPLDLIVRGKVGDHYTFHLTTTIEAPNNEGQLNFKSSFTETLEKVRGSELFWKTDFKVEEVAATGAMQGSEASFKQMDGVTMTSVQNDRGDVLRMIYMGHEIPSKGTSNVVLPGKAAKLGDTWKAVIQVSSFPVPIVYKLAGFESVKGREAARIEGSFPEGSIAKALETTRFLVDLSNGKMLKANAVTEVTLQGKPFKLTYTIVQDGFE